jgi:hypothetical protein
MTPPLLYCRGEQLPRFTAVAVVWLGASASATRALASWSWYLVLVDSAMSHEAGVPACQRARWEVLHASC